MMNRKGFISISVIYTLFMVFLMLMLSVLAAYANNRILLRLSKEDVSDILIESQDSHDLAFACEKEKLSACFVLKYYLDSDLYLHDGEIDVKAAVVDYQNVLEDGDDNVRYSGANPHNYVCFGTDDKSTCVNNKDTFMYRIIGIFSNRTKIIKNTPLSARAWANNSKEWVDSSLKNYLNEDFLNTIPVLWRNKIMETTWNVGELNYNDVVTKDNAPLISYKAEKLADITYAAKIGLMNLSDYYYAASPTFWPYRGDKMTTTSKDYVDAKTNNWLAGYDEFTISPVLDDANKKAFKILKGGKTGSDQTSTALQFRPVFMIYPSMILKSGNGTIDDPYLLQL